MIALQSGGVVFVREAPVLLIVDVLLLGARVREVVLLMEVVASLVEAAVSLVMHMLWLTAEVVESVLMVEAAGLSVMAAVEISQTSETEFHRD